MYVIQIFSSNMTVHEHSPKLQPLAGSFENLLIPPSLGVGFVLLGVLSAVLCSVLVTGITPVITYCTYR